MLRVIFVTLVLMTSFAFSQTQEDFEQKKIVKAEKIDEFPTTNECDLGARLDNLYIHLMNHKDAIGYIINYQGKNVLPANYESNARERLFRNHIMLRRFDPSRIILINGGFREELATELWVVPKGARPPKPTDTIPKPKIPTDKTFLYDKKYLADDYQNDTDEFILESVKARIEEENRIAEEEYRKENPDAADEDKIEEETGEIEERTPEEIENDKFFWVSKKYGELIKKPKNVRGLIIFYADEQYYDIGKLLNHFEQGKRKISEAAKVPADRIQILFGGYRNMIEAEFWIIPNKGEFPAATPEPRPIEDEEEIQ